MKSKPVQIFALIMSFIYVFAGLLLLLTNIMEELITNHQYRMIFGAGLTAYGLFRVRFFFIQLRKKE